MCSAFSCLTSWWMECSTCIWPPAGPVITTNICLQIAHSIRLCWSGIIKSIWSVYKIYCWCFRKYFFCCCGAGSFPFPWTLEVRTTCWWLENEMEDGNGVASFSQWLHCWVCPFMANFPWWYNLGSKDLPTHLSIIPGPAIGSKYMQGSLPPLPAPPVLPTVALF